MECTIDAMPKHLLSKSSLRERAELLVSRKAPVVGKEQALLPLAETRKALHELQVHQIELEMQNEELRRVHEELDLARERYFDLYYLAPVAYCTISQHGLILESNFKVAAILGVTSKRLHQQPLSRYVLRSDQDIYYQLQNRFKANGQSHTCELRMVNLDAKAFWVHLAASAHADEAGEQVLRVVITDISQLKLAEEGQAIAAVTFETHTGKLVTNANKLILRVNQAFTQMTGYAAQDVVGITPSFLRSGRHDAAFYAGIWSSVAATGTWSGEVWNRRKNGHIHLERMDISTVRDKFGSITHYVGNFQDITETESLRVLNAASRERMAALFDGALNSILLTDDAGHYVDANPAACSLLGYTREELLQKKVADIVTQSTGHPETLGLWQRLLDEQRQTGRAALRHKEGHIIVAEYAAVASIQPGVHLSVLSDVSDQVKAQAALQDAQRHLRTLSLRQQEEFDQLRGELARDLHDQLGQTLSALKLEIDMVASRVPDEAQHMYHLVREGVTSVRDVSRALRPVALELGLGSALRAMAAELSMRSDVDIKVHLAVGTPDLSEQTERALYRIAQEALTNAANHASATTIEISLAFERDQLKLLVADDGQGISAADPGSRMGLGLIGMRERAKLIAAEFQLETAPDQGTRITVTLADPNVRSKA
jgi:PAS domain S-box-containing protein